MCIHVYSTRNGSMTLSTRSHQSEGYGSGAVVSIARVPSQISPNRSISFCNRLWPVKAIFLEFVSALVLLQLGARLLTGLAWLDILGVHDILTLKTRGLYP